MSWTTADLNAAAGPDEIRVAPDRRDGTATDPVIIWAIAHDGDLYARSARGPQGLWYRRAIASAHGTVRFGDVEREVEFVDASADADHAALDAAYHAKYDRYGARIVGSVVGPAAHAVTVRITPAR